MKKVNLTKEEVQQALTKHWHMKPAADELNVGYSTLRKYVKQYNIQHDSRVKKGGGTFNKNRYSSKKVTELRRKIKLQSLEYRGGMKCTICGFNEPVPDCYAFHHRDPAQKSPDWQKMKTNTWSFKKMKDELDKCDILCHNCHAKLHYYERMGP